MRPAKVFVNTDFKGHWPVGVSAVVVATSKEHAAALLKQKAPYPDTVSADQFQEVPIEVGYCEVLQDGDY